MLPQWTTPRSYCTHLVWSSELTASYSTRLTQTLHGLGSTAFPKPIMLSHRGLYQQAMVPCMYPLNRPQST